MRPGPEATSASGTPRIRAFWNGLTATGICQEIGILSVSSAFLRLISESTRPGPVHHQLDALGHPVELLEQVEQPRRVPQAGQVEHDDHEDHVGHLEGDEVGRLEPLAGVDDEGGERRLEQAEQAPQGLGIDLGGVLHRDGVGQDVEARCRAGSSTA